MSLQYREIADNEACMAIVWSRSKNWNASSSELWFGWKYAPELDIYSVVSAHNLLAMLSQEKIPMTVKATPWTERISNHGRLCVSATFACSAWHVLNDCPLRPVCDSRLMVVSLLSQLRPIQDGTYVIPFSISPLGTMRDGKLMFAASQNMLACD